MLENKYCVNNESTYRRETLVTTAVTDINTGLEQRMQFAVLAVLTSVDVIVEGRKRVGRSPAGRLRVHHGGYDIARSASACVCAGGCAHTEDRHLSGAQPTSGSLPLTLLLAHSLASPLPQSPGFTFARSRTRRDTSLIAAAAEPDLLSPVDIAAVMELGRRRTEIKCK